jgi:hypothetical protein
MLFNKEFRLIKHIKLGSLLDHVFVNDKFVCVLFAHRPSSCCILYDSELNQIESFGQQVHPDKPFYLEKSLLVTSVGSNTSSNKYKLQPKVFGITYEHIYLYNQNKMTIMDRASGQVLHQLPLAGDVSYFLLDRQNRIIEVKPESKRIAVHDFDRNNVIRNTYSDDLGDVFVTAENRLAFIDNMKESVLFL